MAHLVKKLVLAASAAALVSVPASARGGWGGGRHHDGIDAGDVIAGALVIGGIAAIASAASSSRDRGYGYDRGRSRYDDDYGYNRNGYGSRMAVDQCVRAAQRDASRYGGWARVTDVTSIDRVRGGYEVRGRLVVENDRYRGNWRGGRDRFGYNYDRYGNDYDKGRFSCTTRYGGIDGLRVSGLRNNRW